MPPFAQRELVSEVATVRDRHAPGALVLDSERDFETLAPEVAEDLGLLVDALDPLSYPEEWLPSDAPGALRRFAGRSFTVGTPGDGGVAWTRQTDPPVVLVKPRLAGSPDPFVEFLIANALVEVGLDVPEQFLGFFRERYRDLARAVPLGPADTYQLAAALYDAYLGLLTREVYAGWSADADDANVTDADAEYADGDDADGDRADSSGSLPGLYGAWRDAGERLEPRLGDLPREVATDRTSFAAAAELACSAVKHDLELPTPFAALDSSAYRQYGAEYAVRWAEKTFEELEE